MSDYVTKAYLEEGLKKLNRELASFIEKANGEVAASKTLSNETKAALETLSAKATEITDRLLALEQKQLSAPADNGQMMTIGEKFTALDKFDLLQSSRLNRLRMETKAITNATGQNQPLVPSQRVPGIVAEPDRPLRVRDLLPVGRTGSNLIEYTRELVFTNNAAPQTAEGATKAESNITFELLKTGVVTLAHFIVVSKQVLADAPQLQSYINTRLMYGLKLEEDDQLLNGDGTGQNLSGLLDTGNFTAYNRTTAGDTKIDVLRRAITQVSLSEYPADAFVLHPADWEDIELQKETGGAYVWANPAITVGPQIWGRRVVTTTAITEGKFLTGSFALAAQIWDREQAAITVSYEDGNNFKQNLATILAEERLALTVYRPKALVYGDLPA